MPISASDIASLGYAGGNPVEAMASGYKLADLAGQQQLNKMKMASAQQEMQDVQTLKSLAKNYDLSTQEGQAKYVAEAIKVNPEYGMKAQKGFAEVAQGQNELLKSQYDIMGKQLEAEAGALSPLAMQARQMQAQGRTKDEINAALMPAAVQSIKALSQTMLPNGKPVLPQEQAAQMMAKFQDPNLDLASSIQAVAVNHAKFGEMLKMQQQKFGATKTMTGEQGPGVYQQNATTGQWTKVGGMAPTAGERGGAVDGGPKVHSSKILDDGTVVNVMADGKVEVQTPDGESVTGDARREALKSANQQGADIQGERARARQTATDAAKTVNQAFGSVQAIRNNIGNLKEAISAIDKGADTGAIASRFPNLTSASIELQNIQSKLGLDVIGSVTFGALSEGELNLALQTALPTGLDQPQLKEWLTRRIAAQEKLSDYLTKQATYLSKPGATQAGWMEKMQTEKSPAPSSSGAPPSPPGATGGGTPKQITEGTIAYGPDGRKIIVRGGEWQPMN